MDFFSKTLETLVFKVMGLGLGIIASVLLVRGLTVEDFGRYALLTTLIGTLATVFTFGQHAANVYYVSRNPGHAARLTANTLIYAVAISLLVIVVFYFWGDGLVRQFFPSSRFPPELFKFFTLLFPIILLLTMTPSLLRGLYLIREFNATQLLIPFLKIIFFYLALWVLERGLLGAVEAFLLVNVVVAAAVIALAVWHSGIYPTFSIHLFKESITYGGQAYVGELAGLCRDGFVILTLGYFLSSTELALFVIAKNLASLVQTVNQAANVPLLPRLTREQGDLAVGLVCRANRMFVFSSTLGVVAASVLGPFIIPVVYGDEYDSSVFIFLMLLPGVIGYTVTDVLTTYFMSRGWPSVRTVINIFSGLLTVLSVWLVMWVGGNALNAALTVSLANLITAVFASVYFHRLVGGELGEMFFVNRGDLSEIINGVKEYSPFRFMRRKGVR